MNAKIRNFWKFPIYFSDNLVGNKLRNENFSQRNSELEYCDIFFFDPKSIQFIGGKGHVIMGNVFM